MSLDNLVNCWSRLFFSGVLFNFADLAEALSDACKIDNNLFDNHLGKY